MPLAPINGATTAANPIDGFGTILEYSVDAGATWKQVANLVDVKPHEVGRNKIKTTTHSTTSKNNTYRPGLGEPGETDFVLLYDKTAYEALMAVLGVAVTGANLTQWRTTYRDAATDEIIGYLDKIKVVTPMEGDATIEAKVQHSGDSTLVTT